MKKNNKNYSDPLQRKLELQRRAKFLRENMTPGEIRTWSILKQHPLSFNRQFIIHEFIADFVCQELKLVIEIDGVSHDQAPPYKDFNRQKYIEKLGWRVIRFHEEDVVRYDLYYDYPDRLCGTINNYMKEIGLTYEEAEKRKKERRKRK